MNPRELEHHLQDLFEGCIEPEALEALEHELRSNRSSWDVYRDYVHLHNSLQLRADGIDLMHVIPMDRVIARRRSRDLRRALLSAAALLLIAGLVAALVKITPPRAPRLTVEAAADTQWTIDGTKQSADIDQQTVGIGSNVSVQSGTIHLQTDAGVAMVLQGPASVDFPRLEKPVLKRGWLWIDSGESGTTCEVTTPELVVRDIGTRFGVRVPEEGPAEVHLIDGKVEIMAKSSKAILATLVPDGKGFSIPPSGEPSEVDLARDPFPGLEELLDAPANYTTTVLSQNPAGLWRLNGDKPRVLANEMPGGLVGRAGSGASGGRPGPRPVDGFEGFEPANLAMRLSGSGAASSISLGTTPVHTGVLFRDDFDGRGPLNRTRPDVSTNDEKWVAVDSQSSFSADGSFRGKGDKTESSRGGSATLAFKPVDGVRYTLEASLSGMGGAGSWSAFGFAKGQGSQASKDARFLGGAVAGRVWMILNDVGLNRATGAVLGTTGSTGGVADARPWIGWSNDKLDNVDLRIVLDTTGGSGSWTATWFAKKPADRQYITVRETTRLLNEDISSVGFAVGGQGATGTIRSFSLRAERKAPVDPGPAKDEVPAQVSLKEGAVSFWIRRSAEGARRELLWAAGRSPEDDAIHAHLEADGQVGFFMENKRYDILLTSGQSVVDGRWHHLAFCWSPQVVALYIDGRQVASDTDFRGGQQGSLSELRFGNGPKAARMAPFTGLIDEIARWDRSLTHTEVTQQFRSARGTPDQDKR